MSKEFDDRTRARLLTEHPGDDIGTWHIYGEDPNCDLGGSHIEPLLGTVTGRYSDIIEHALQLPHFYSWGYGGRIVKVNVVSVTPETLQTRNKLRAERDALKERLTEVERELKRYE